MPEVDTIKTHHDEFTGPGSAYQVIKQHENNQSNSSNVLPVFITISELEKKNKNKIN